MSYTRTWDETRPQGNITPADQIDSEIQYVRQDLRERVAGIFGLTALEFAADPIVPKHLTLTGALIAATLAGALTGNVTGNASTASALATPRTINGVNFDGTANITVPAAAGTLTGAALAANVLASSLTSVGTLTNLGVTGAVTAGSFAGPLTGNVTGNVTGSSGSCTGNAATATVAASCSGNAATATNAGTAATATNALKGQTASGFTASVPDGTDATLFTTASLVVGAIYQLVAVATTSSAIMAAEYFSYDGTVLSHINSTLGSGVGFGNGAGTLILHNSSGGARVFNWSYFRLF